MQNHDKDEEQKEAEEKKALLEYIRIQNENLKRIFKNTIDQKKKDE